MRSKSGVTAEWNRMSPGAAVALMGLMLGIDMRDCFRGGMSSGGIKQGSSCIDTWRGRRKEDVRDRTLVGVMLPVL